MKPITQIIRSEFRNWGEDCGGGSAKSFAQYVAKRHPEAIAYHGKGKPDGWLEELCVAEWRWQDQPKDKNGNPLPDDPELLAAAYSRRAEALDRFRLVLESLGMKGTGGTLESLIHQRLAEGERRAAIEEDMTYEFNRVGLPMLRFGKRTWTLPRGHRRTPNPEALFERMVKRWMRRNPDETSRLLEIAKETPDPDHTFAETAIPAIRQDMAEDFEAWASAHLGRMIDEFMAEKVVAGEVEEVVDRDGQVSWRRLPHSPRVQ